MHRIGFYCLAAPVPINPRLKESGGAVPNVLRPDDLYVLWDPPPISRANSQLKGFPDMYDALDPTLVSDVVGGQSSASGISA